MVGQWIGLTIGNNHGVAVLNIESQVEGAASLWGGRIVFTDFDNSNVNFYCVTQFTITDNIIKGKLFDFYIFDYRTLQLVKQDAFSSLYPGSNTPQAGEIDGVVNGDQITGIWKTNIGTNGKFTVQRSKAGIAAEPGEVMAWNDFRRLVEEDKDKSIKIYRGQKETKYRLRTSFHRNCRNDFIRFAQEDFKILAHHINSNSSYKYDINNPEDYYALLSLAQHHGFPTPLLDWTESPYIAAYFAFEDLEKDQKDGYVRIYIFDITKWQVRCPELKSIIEPQPSITIRVFPVVNNNRAIPQQSVFAISNVDDIEAFIKIYEDYHKEKYLRKIDLLVSERKRAMRELQLMGITAASLFPGFDGICKYLKERCFQQ